ncbi:RmlC-like cupin domain-containing protein [Mycena floridula]|nr:RmlC-like cupin domain-containing protein [Mycena floridula]
MSKIFPRRSDERGNSNLGWLKGFHTFAVANYRSSHQNFASLRVINEDRVAPYTGFGTHSHSEFEIFSYIVAGEIEHQDSMGNTEVLKRGDVQLTSAGTGISHSEKAHGSQEAHFLQIWAFPSQPRLQPKYFTRHFSDAEKKDKWVRVVAPVDAEGVHGDQRDGEGAAPVNSPLTMYATLVSKGMTVSQAVIGPKAYLQVVQSSGYNPNAATGATVKVTAGQGVEEVLREGDGAYILTGDAKDVQVENLGDIVAEIVLFDLQ